MDKASSHRLHAMFNADSIALVGASARPNSFGQRLIKSVSSTGFLGEVSYVNPSYSEISGQTCYSSLLELKNNVPHLAILGVGSKNLEQSLIDAIEIGVKSAVIYDSCHGMATDGKTPLLERLRELAHTHGIAVCGGSCMGFINVPDKRVGTYYSIPDDLKTGGITLIAHSGSVFTVLALSDRRYHFDLIVSPGQEISVSMEECIEYALLRSNTKVITLFMEGCRHPQKFQQVLALAQKKQVPIIVCKVGQTEQSSSMAQSHTGTIAGSQTTYQALFDCYGVISVDSIDQMMNTALLFSQERTPSQSGGLAMMADSGGLSELIVDRCHALDVPLAKVGTVLREQLKNILPSSLAPTNPLDYLDALTDDYHEIAQKAFVAFSQSSEVSILGLEADFRDDYIYVDELFDFACRLTKLTDKPCFFYSDFSQANNKRIAKEFSQLNLPVINGSEEVLIAVKLFLGWHKNINQYHKRQNQTDPQYSPELLKRWQSRLLQSHSLDESQSLDLLNDFGLKVIAHDVCEDWQTLHQLAEKIGYPAVLKTAMPTIHHKSDKGGVILDIQNQNQLHEAYQRLQNKLGNRVLLQPMLKNQENSIELAFGCIVDKDFGAVIMLSAGGVLIEVLQDRQFALAPFSVEYANQMIENLTVSKLFNGYRNKPAVNKQALAEGLSNFSMMCATLKEHFQEIDVNPVIVNEREVIAVDALVVIADN